MILKGKYMKDKIGLITLENADEINDIFIFDGNNQTDYLNGSSELNEQDISIDTISELTDSLISLEEIRNIVEINDGKNITSSAIKPLIAAVEHICRRNNVKFVKTFSLESFDSKITRNTSLKIVTENLLSTIKTFILKIIEWLKKACDYIYKFIRSFSNNSETLAQRAKEIQKISVSLNNKKIREGVHGINGGSLTKFFSSNSKLIDPNEIPSYYSEYNSKLGLSFKENYMRDILNSIKNIVSNVSSGDKENGIYSQVNKVLTEQIHVSFKHFQKIKGDDLSYEYKLPFGQKIVKITYVKKENKLTGLSISLVSDITNYPVNDKAILSILTPQQIDSISKVVGEEMTNGLYKNHEKTIKEIEDISRLVNKECDNIVRRQLAQENDSDKNLTYSVQFLKDLVASMLSILGIIHKYDVLTSKNCLDYCEQSAKLYV